MKYPMWMMGLAALGLVFLMGNDACDPGLTETGTELEVCDMTPMDDYDLGSAEILGDDLLLTVSYGGGCEAHQFQLCWADTFAESDPVQTGMTLIHDGNGDACEAYATEDLVFDLTPLKDRWMEMYGGNTGTILIGIDGEGLDYSF